MDRLEQAGIDMRGGRVRDRRPKMDELKPCKSCGGIGKIGGTSQLFPDHRIDIYVAVCVKCGMRTGECFSYSEAIEAWNRRPIEDALRARIAELEA